MKVVIFVWSSKIKCDTLIIRGAKDDLVTCLHAYYLYEHITGSWLEVIEEGNHDLHLVYSDKFNKSVKDFLSNDKQHVCSGKLTICVVNAI